MNPTKVGDSETDVPCRNPDNEKALIFQEFLFDDSKTVAEILNESGIKILEFKRFECGEPESEEEETEPPEDINLEQAKEVAT